ncbi:hypothetical protein ACFQGE_04540 [Halomicroarcula sp. GCM10025817]|uniref:hypothetical protein n=1 Tax=Haloarcula TaxID=2237 RepID=UPI0023E82C38|nr:hypothetical protein [Halomicroarcula sp. SYNS111]
MRPLRSHGQLWAALLTGLLLLVPVVLAGYPLFQNDGFPGPYTRADAVLVFFVAVALLFTAFAVYEVARYHGVVGDGAR